MNQNNRNNVTLDDWQRLYAAAIRVREMEPWAWMEDADVFGIWPDGRDMAAFVSVMGMLGKYCAVAVYPGPKELHQFWQMHAMPEDEHGVDQLADIAQIQAIFGSARDLEAEDKAIIKKLGLQFRGPHAWPRFRSFRPGYFPWFLEPHEVRLLTVALEQLLEVAPRIRKDPALLTAKARPECVLVRAPAGNSPDGPWQESWHVFPPPATTFRVEVSKASMAAVQSLKPSGLTFEVNVFPMPARIERKGERPLHPYGLLVVDSESIFILGIDLLQVDSTLEAMWASVPARVMEILSKNGIRPASLAVCTPWVYMVLHGACEELGIELKRKDRLRALDMVRRDMEQHFTRDR